MWHRAVRLGILGGTIRSVPIFGLGLVAADHLHCHEGGCARTTRELPRFVDGSFDSTKKPLKIVVAHELTPEKEWSA